MSVPFWLTPLSVRLGLWHTQHEFSGSRFFWFDALRLTVVQEVLNGCLEFAAHFRDGFPVETDDGAESEHPADEDVVPFVVFDAGGLELGFHGPVLPSSVEIAHSNL
jgi:hypothetical protein